MTTSKKETENNKQASESNSDNGTLTRTSVPHEIMDIMEYLSRNNKIVFKSQQRDEPELQRAEKLKVALDVYRRNPQTFLIRFGNYLEENHLKDFARLSIAESDEEMHLMVQDYQYKLKTRQRDVKNRRYTALQELIKEGEYFSEQEMMKRQPELYQDLVGQYLSNKEKQQRDSYDVRNTTFSGILMHNLEQKQLTEIIENTKNYAEYTQVEESSSASSDNSIGNRTLDNSEKDDSEIPLNCRQQWGNFDNEHIACSSSKLHIKKSCNNKIKPIPVLDLITADERELLRQEFISQMYEQFLTGQDKEFDYATVDNNAQYDDLNLLNQDQEDKYFEESDEDNSEIKDDVENNFLSQSKIKNNEESEDELDAYMAHLNKHHSLQNFN